MKTRKPFEGHAPNRVSTDPISQEDGGAVISLPAKGNATTVRTLDLTPYLGQSIDGWVWACAAQLRAFLSGDGVTIATIESYWHAGLCYFFDFLITEGVPCQPATLEKRHLDAYVDWLKGHGEWAYGTQKNNYDHTKPVLVGLQQRTVVKGGRELFPANPFPGSNSRRKGATPLSTGERIRLAEAIREDLIAIHKGRFDGSASKALVVHLVALAFRTGANTTPLVDINRDCLKPHPFMPNMMLLELFKQRGNATHLKSLRFSKAEERSKTIPMDGVALVRKVLEMTQPLADAAPDDLKDFVWLYRGEGTSKKNSKLTRLRVDTLKLGIQSLIDRHQLKGDDGQPLSINTSRLRKTMEHRLWHLSGGDLVATAAIMGHAPQVADNNYLACTNEMRENATFVGEALPDIYRNGEQGDANGDVIPIIPMDKTPVGRCKDPYGGDKAPKDGTPCDDFFACFGCRSYAVVGSPEDLYRLFSFYWFLEREKERARSNDWLEQFHNTMRLIDAFTLDKFDRDVVLAAKERARVDPHPFWKSYMNEPPATGTDHG
jgi:hypothetical protein